MPENNQFSNVSVNIDLTKPVDTLIKKISNAVGAIFEPKQIKRIAEAESEAAIIKANSEIQINDLQKRALQRFLNEETQKQQNIESITTKSFSLLNKSAKPENIENDWIINFFDKSKIISDGEMQNLWSRILAGEANNPGKYSKRIVNTLASLDKNEALSFQNLCRFVCHIENPLPLIFDYKANIYEQEGIDFIKLSHLDSIGLIHLSHVQGFVVSGLEQDIYINYFDKTLLFKITPQPQNGIRVGEVLFTKVGEELFSLCSDLKPVSGFWDYAVEEFKKHYPENIELK